jgi:tRNA (cytidine56-2'-O)-methyltransferase
MVIEILRLGHRRKRDERLTTHVCLIARALGADRVWVAEEDSELEKTISSVVERFGGKFEIKTGVGWKTVMRNFKGTKVHLTMYGLPLKETLGKIPKGDVLVIVGSEKVPGEVYQMADFNIAVGSQPHSEAGALAVFLDRFTNGSWEDKKFSGGQIEVIPTAFGKGVRKQ